MPENLRKTDISTTNGLSLCPQELSTLFPSYLKLDRTGIVLEAGPSLLHHCGPELIHSNLFEVAKIELPGSIREMAQLRHHRRAIILRLQGRAILRLRGLVLDRGDDVWLMLGHIPDLETSEDDQPLRVSDFSPTDGTLDMMLAAELRSGLLAETRALAEALDEQRSQAEAANRAKSVFLTTMSHEIRTPMNAVLGVASILAETDITPEQREWLNVMVDSGKSLMELLNNILDLSKIESGAMTLNPEVFDLHLLGKSVHALYAPTALAKGVKTDLVLDLDSTMYLADLVRIRQILSNLVGNAVKFTEVGTIEIRLKDDLDEEGNRFLNMIVRDTGIGISQEAIARLFNVFSQADSSTTRRYGGTGLGLSISKRLCDQMGGEIQVESRLGRGSTFTARIPIQIASKEDAPLSKSDVDVSEEAAEPRHILIVDDNGTNRKILSHFLGRLGHSFDLANDGQQALAIWEEKEFDAIIMDIEMPVLDGLEATRELRRREISSDRRYTPIIALSADAMIQKQETAISVGMDDYLTKPVGLKEIETHLKRLFSSAGAHSSA